jgi:hypothetical protein
VKKSGKEKERIQIRIVRSTELRLEEWRRDPALVSYAMGLFRDPRFHLLLDVLKTEAPSNYGLPSIGVTSDDRLAYASKIEGYHLALNNLESMTRLLEGAKHIEATFEPEQTL